MIKLRIRDKVLNGSGTSLTKNRDQKHCELVVNLPVGHFKGTSHDVNVPGAVKRVVIAPLLLAYTQYKCVIICLHNTDV